MGPKKATEAGKVEPIRVPGLRFAPQACYIPTAMGGFRILGFRDFGVKGIGASAGH